MKMVSYCIFFVHFSCKGHNIVSDLLTLEVNSVLSEMHAKCKVFHTSGDWVFENVWVRGYDEKSEKYTYLASSHIQAKSMS